LRDNIRDAEGDACPGPQHHHGRLEAGSIVTPVVEDDLGDQLYRPEYRTRHAQDICSDDETTKRGIYDRVRILICSLSERK
jgi:hypothetical protein